MTDAILVTGASSGIGLATAVYLAKHRFEVYVTLRDLGHRDALDAEAARHNVKLNVLQLDVNDQTSIDKAVNTVVERSGGIYAVINNAGILIRGYFEDLSDEEMRRVFNTNVFGTMAVTRTVLPFMRAAQRGRIIIMSSAGGKIASPGASAYCSSKFALEGFGESLAQEVLPFGVHVSLIEPGFIQTELFGRNRHTAANASDPSRPYYQWFQRVEALTDEQLRRVGKPPIKVAKAVYAALTADRPRLRYIVGRRAKLLINLRRYAPGELFDRLWIRQVVRRTTRSEASSQRVG